MIDDIGLNEWDWPTTTEVAIIVFFYAIIIPLLIWFSYALLTGRFGKKRGTEKDKKIVRLIGAVNIIVLLSFFEFVDPVLWLETFCVVSILSFVFYFSRVKNKMLPFFRRLLKLNRR